MKRFLEKMVKFYQKCISPLFAPHCRYYPTCSNYMLIAIKKHGCFLGLIMGIARILRCQPLVHGGYDPVPDKFTIFRNKKAEKEYRKRMHLN